jgi:cell division protein FtsQ
MKAELSPRVQRVRRNPPSYPPATLDAPAVDLPSRANVRAQAILAAARSAFGVLLILGIVGGLVASLRHYVRVSPRFGLATMDLIGNKRFAKDEVFALAGIARGDNLFVMDLEQTRKNLLASPWISEAKLARDLPGTLHVEVTERVPAALVALGDLFIATRAGEVFKRSDLGDPSDLPVITGLDAAWLTEDRATLEKSVQHALDLAADYDASALSKREPLQQIHARADGSLSLFVGKNATELVFGRSPYRRKLEQASRVLDDVRRRGAKAETVLLDNEARPDRVVVRMR